MLLENKLPPPIGDEPPAKTGVVAARVKLEALAVEIEMERIYPPEAAAGIREIIKENLHRRKPISVGISRRPTMLTEEMKEGIIAAKRENPDLTYTELGDMFDGLNIGGVSRALRGLRE